MKATAKRKQSLKKRKFYLNSITKKAARAKLHVAQMLE